MRVRAWGTFVIADCGFVIADFRERDGGGWLAVLGWGFWRGEEDEDEEEDEEEDGGEAGRVVIQVQRVFIAWGSGVWEPIMGMWPGPVRARRGRRTLCSGWPGAMRRASVSGMPRVPRRGFSLRRAVSFRGRSVLTWRATEPPPFLRWQWAQLAWSQVRARVSGVAVGSVRGVRRAG
jgi:hypothetical protein